MSVKNEIRAKNLQILKNRAKSGAKCRDYAVLSDIKRLIKIYKPKNILLFMPLFYEPNVYRLRREFSKNCNIFVPFMVGISLEMVKLALPFRVSKFNLKEPINKNAFKSNIDMAVVPVVGVDVSMARIGHGKGFYDRFFASLKRPPKVVVFVQIMDLFTKQKLAQSHDIICDFYLTPKKKYFKRGKDDRNFSRIRCWRGRRWRGVCGR
ncbi:5-formyltetrahydrofolate cyclo-ligase [Campylobacter gastrosuis]|uniref:5-formyltetrahydrofolate cyclo-ligase n=1 Tax=Campylobacter gastrosuis TaxID=2974576 RepID=A0ABT7HS33_9BACT|nr:5-formyltetrahydrofolate cyclo-ligase [Campylobacter gastrosuis]MDL0089716.1 5-formyltetrahydrofolate cyclo-ligase [Campylobacter gastrosuis]